jgi:hypothetical protein
VAQVRAGQRHGLDVVLLQKPGANEEGCEPCVASLAAR